MKYFITALFALTTFNNSFAQTTKPIIGSDADIKEKIFAIKSAFPNLVQTFGKNGNTSYGTTNYQTELKVGKGMIFLSKNSEKEELKIIFSNIYYGGTKDDFHKFYEQLIADIKEIFGTSYYSEPGKPSVDGKRENVFFYENGKNIMNSPTIIYLSFDSAIGLDVELHFSTHRKIS